MSWSRGLLDHIHVGNRQTRRCAAQSSRSRLHNRLLRIQKCIILRDLSLLQPEQLMKISSLRISRSTATFLT